MKRNLFLNPRIYDPEYVITRLRCDDLKVLVKKYLAQNGKSTVIDFGSRESPYKAFFSEHIDRFLMADLVLDNNDPHIDIKIDRDGHLHHPSNSVDMVLSLQVLEHVPNVELYLEEAHRVLKPGGILWLTTHGMWPYHPTPEDYYRWTLSGLSRIVGSRFQVVETDGIMGGPSYALMIYMHLLWEGTRKLNSIQGRIFGTKVKKELFFPLGNILFWALAIPLNLVMMGVDYATPRRFKEKESAIFRIAARKKV